MEQLIKQSTALYTFPFTVFLAISLLFWLVTIFTGFGDFDADVDTGEFDVDADAEGDVDGDGFFAHAVEIITLGEAPLTVAFSIWFLCIWFLSVQLNTFVNPNAYNLIGFGLLIPIIIASTFISRQIVKPIGKFFKALNRVEKIGNKTIGGICFVGCEVSNKGGFAEIKTEASPIQINVFTDGDEVIEKGGRAIVLEFNKEKNRYLIESFTEEI